MIFKHKTTDIQETNNKKFLNDDEKNIVQNIKRYNSSNHSFTKSIQLRDTKKLTVPRINIEGECYQNLLDMGTGISYKTYNISNGEVEVVYRNRDFIMIKNVARTSSILLWINAGNMLDIIKPSTNYTLVLDFYSDKTIKRTYTKIMGHDVQNANSNAVDMVINKKSGRLFIPITTLSTIDKSNPKMACIYNQFAVDNLAEGDRFYFGNARLFQGTITEEQYRSNGRITGITGVGDKSRNLFNPKLAKRKTINIDTGVISSDSKRYLISDFIEVKPNQQYVVYDEMGISSNSRYYLEYDENKNFIGSYSLERDTSYCNFNRFTVSENARFIIVRFWCRIEMFGNTVPKDFSEYSNVMLREDLFETVVFEPFYEGYKVSILTRNSNLLDPSTFITGNIRSVSLGGNDWEFVKNDNVYGDITATNLYLQKGFVTTNNLIRVSPNTGYIVSRTHDNDGLGIIIEKIFFYDENGRAICGNIDNYSERVFNAHNFSFTTHKNTVYIRPVFKSSIGNDVLISPNNVKDAGFIIRESKSCEEELALSDKSDIYLDVPLLKLPDGTKDEIKDGYLIRRVGKVVFNGTEHWVTCNADSDEYSNFVETTPSNCRPSAKIRCDALITRDDTSEDKVASYNNTLGIMCTQGGLIRIRHREGKINAAEVKEWLKDNNVTLYYELNTPIITKINQDGLSVHDNYTEIYTDTNLSSPKQFTLPGNLTSRISTNKDRLFSLKERISKLEEISLTSVLNTIDIKDGEGNEKI